jgi:hypothetical protein
MLSTRPLFFVGKRLYYLLVVNSISLPSALSFLPKSSKFWGIEDKDGC